MTARLPEAERAARREARRAADAARAADRARRTRWRVTLNVRGSWDPATRRHVRFAWPVAFATEREALDAVESRDPFRPNPALPGKVRSVAVERYLLAPDFEERRRSARQRTGA